MSVNRKRKKRQRKRDRKRVELRRLRWKMAADASAILRAGEALGLPGSRSSKFAEMLKALRDLKISFPPINPRLPDTTSLARAVERMFQPPSTSDVVDAIASIASMLGVNPKGEATVLVKTKHRAPLESIRFNLEVPSLGIDLRGEGEGDGEQ